MHSTIKKINKLKLRLVICGVILLLSHGKTFCKNKLTQNSEFQKSAIYSTENGDITVSVENDRLTGIYEYYDKWDDKFHEFMNKNEFYIYGISTDNTHYNIYTGLPGDEKLIQGSLTFLENRNKIKIILSRAPNGYDNFDFTVDGADNVFRIKEFIDCKEIRIVRANKATLYNFNGSAFSAKKAYLVIFDPVSIVDYKLGYFKILYRSPTTDKTSIYWIKEEDLYPSDPHDWSL